MARPLEQEPDNDIKKEHELGFFRNPFTMVHSRCLLPSLFPNLQYWSSFLEAVPYPDGHRLDQQSLRTSTTVTGRLEQRVPHEFINKSH
jgi:hypothetical protein